MKAASGKAPSLRHMAVALPVGFAQISIQRLFAHCRSDQGGGTVGEE